MPELRFIRFGSGAMLSRGDGRAATGVLDATPFIIGTMFSVRTASPSYFVLFYSVRSLFPSRETINQVVFFSLLHILNLQSFLSTGAAMVGAGGVAAKTNVNRQVHQRPRRSGHPAKLEHVVGHKL